MIAEESEELLLSHLEHYLIPAKDSAIFIDTYNPDHVMLLLANNGYSRAPVITKDKKYVGTISIVDIMFCQAKNQLADWELTQTDIGKMVNTRMETISETSNLTDIMHLLVDYSSLPVLDKNDQFLSTITRKPILKAVNSLLHDLADYYTIIPEDD